MVTSQRVNVEPLTGVHRSSGCRKTSAPVLLKRITWFVSTRAWKSPSIRQWSWMRNKPLNVPMTFRIPFMMPTFIFGSLMIRKLMVVFSSEARPCSDRGSSWSAFLLLRKTPHLMFEKWGSELFQSADEMVQENGKVVMMIFSNGLLVFL